MADDEDQQNDSDSQKGAFLCCRKKCLVVVCINCTGVFHKSCVLRNKNYEIISDSLIKCCEPNPSTDDQVHDNLNQASSYEVQKLKFENIMLKKLLEASESKFQFLQNNNKLLEENKKLLEEKIELIKNEFEINTKNVNKTTQIKNHNKESYSMVTSKQTLPVQKIVNSKTDNKHQNIGETSQVQTNQKITNKKEDYVRELEAVQLNKMKDIINLATDKKDDEQFKSISYKKTKRQVAKFFGESDNNEFAIKRKVWLYLYRIKRHITSEKIRKFIADQPQFKDADITVKELPTQETQNKCFMFGIDWDFRDDIYKPSIWPKSMAFKRFDFNKYHTYQNQLIEDF